MEKLIKRLCQNFNKFILKEQKKEKHLRKDREIIERDNKQERYAKKELNVGNSEKKTKLVINISEN